MDYGVFLVAAAVLFCALCAVKCFGQYSIGTMIEFVINLTAGSC